MNVYQIDLDDLDYYIDYDGLGLNLSHCLRCRAGLNGVISSFGAGDWLSLHQLGVL